MGVTYVHSLARQLNAVHACENIQGKSIFVDFPIYLVARLASAGIYNVDKRNWKEVVGIILDILRSFRHLMENNHVVIICEGYPYPFKENHRPHRQHQQQQQTQAQLEKRWWTNQITFYMVKQLVEAHNMQCEVVLAPFEAEYQCCYLAGQLGDAALVASNDSDCLLLGVSIIKNALTNTPTIVNHHQLASGLQVSTENLILLGYLLPNDYSFGLRNLGQVALPYLLSLLSQHDKLNDSIEDVFRFLKQLGIVVGDASQLQAQIEMAKTAAAGIKSHPVYNTISGGGGGEDLVPIIYDLEYRDCFTESVACWKKRSILSCPEWLQIQSIQHIQPIQHLKEEAMVADILATVSTEGKIGTANTSYNSEVTFKNGTYLHYWFMQQHQEQHQHQSGETTNYNWNKNIYLKVMDADGSEVRVLRLSSKSNTRTKANPTLQVKGFSSDNQKKKGEEGEGGGVVLVVDKGRVCFSWKSPGLRGETNREVIDEVLAAAEVDVDSSKAYCGDLTYKLDDLEAKVLVLEVDGYEGINSAFLKWDRDLSLLPPLEWNVVKISVASNLQLAFKWQQKAEKEHPMKSNLTVKEVQETKTRQDKFFKSRFSSIIGVSWTKNDDMKNGYQWSRGPANGDGGTSFALKADAEESALASGKVDLEKSLKGKQWLTKCRYAASEAEVKEFTSNLSRSDIEALGMKSLSKGPKKEYSSRGKTKQEAASTSTSTAITTADLELAPRLTLNLSALLKHLKSCGVSIEEGTDIVNLMLIQRTKEDVLEEEKQEKQEKQEEKKRKREKEKKEEKEKSKYVQLILGVDKIPRVGTIVEETGDIVVVEVDYFSYNSTNDTVKMEGKKRVKVEKREITKIRESTFNRGVGLEPGLALARYSSAAKETPEGRMRLEEEWNRQARVDADIEELKKRSTSTINRQIFENKRGAGYNYQQRRR